jgi:hypothetical protein
MLESSITKQQTMWDPARRLGYDSQSAYRWVLLEVNESTNSTCDSIFVLNYVIESLQNRLSDIHRIPYPHEIEALGVRLGLLRSAKTLDIAEWEKEDKPFAREVAHVLANREWAIENKQEISLPTVERYIRLTRNRYLKSNFFLHYLTFDPPLSLGEREAFSLVFHWPGHQILSKSQLRKYLVDHPEIVLEGADVFEPKTQARTDRDTDEIRVHVTLPPGYFEKFPAWSRPVRFYDLSHDTLSAGTEQGKIDGYESMLRQGKLFRRIVSPKMRMQYTIHWEVQDDLAYTKWRAGDEVVAYDEEFNERQRKIESRVKPVLEATNFSLRQYLSYQCDMNGGRLERAAVSFNVAEISEALVAFSGAALKAIRFGDGDDLAFVGESMAKISKEIGQRSGDEVERASCSFAAARLEFVGRIVTRISKASDSEVTGDTDGLLESYLKSAAYKRGGRAAAPLNERDIEGWLADSVVRTTADGRWSRLSQLESLAQGVSSNLEGFDKQRAERFQILADSVFYFWCGSFPT